jgi:zinc transporter ZupT
MTLSVALLFAAVFLFGGRLAYQPGQRGRRKFLSFAAGISVAYTFVHVLPAIHAIREFDTHSPIAFQRWFPEYSVYLWTMAGFLVFYGLETMVAKPCLGPEHSAAHDGGAPPWQSWVHIGGFALYAWILTYVMVWTGKAKLGLCLYAVAMGLHLFPITCSLSTHYQAMYDRRGAWLLALASLAGWACGLVLDIPKSIVLNLVAVVVGGVIVNAAIAELPREKEGRFWFFLAGAVVYTALLLTLSHFEKGGES